MNGAAISPRDRPAASPAPKASGRIRARTIWLKVHLYLALVLGAFIAVLGITGALLVFHPEIERTIHSDLPPPQVGAPRIAPDEVVEIAERKLQLPVSLLRMPRPDFPVYVLELFDGHTNDYRIATIDAATGELLRDRVWGRTFVTFLFDVHTHLLVDEYGLLIVGCLGFVLLISIATGVYLWWPRSGQVRQAFVFRWRRSALPLNFETHRISGIYLSLILAVVAISGSYIALPEVFTPLVELFGPVSGEPEEVPSLPAPDGARPLTLADVQGVLRSSVPGARLTSIVLPDHARDSFSAHFIGRGEPDNHYGQSTLWIDQYTGQVLRSHSYSDLGRADRLITLQLPLHNGEYFGLTGRILVFIAGLMLCVMYGTGLYLWWKRRQRAG